MFVGVELAAPEVHVSLPVGLVEIELAAPKVHVPRVFARSRRAICANRRLC